MSERERIRAKMSERDRNFMDALRLLFPSCRLVGIRFNDGEQIGKLENDNDDQEKNEKGQENEPAPTTPLRG